MNQAKDARFIKKKILPHKIIQDISTKRTYIDSNTLNLGRINVGNYEIKTIKRRQFECLYLLKITIDRRLMNLLQFGFSCMRIVN